MSRFWKRARRAVGIGLLSVPYLFAPAAAQSDCGSLSGRVEDAFNRPVAGAVVSENSLWVAGESTTDTTDAEGNYFIEGCKVPVSGEQGPSSSSFGIDSVFPNPFSRSTNLCVDLPRSDDLEVIVFDVLGRRVHQSSTQLPAGFSCHQVDVGSLADGTYFIRAQAGDAAANRKVTYNDAAPAAHGGTGDRSIDFPASSRGFTDNLEVSVVADNFEPDTVMVPSDVTQQDFTIQYVLSSQEVSVESGLSEGLEGAFIAYDVNSDGTIDFEATTNSDGLAQFEERYAGLADLLTITADGHEDLILSDVDFGSDLQSYSLNFAVNTDQVRVVTPNGNGVLGADVTWDVDGDGEPEYSAVTDVDGLAEVSDEYYGPVSVLTVNATGYDPREFTDAFFGDEVQNLSIVDSPFSASLLVQGEGLDGSLTPVSGADVDLECMINDNAVSFSGATDGSGVYSLSWSPEAARLMGGEYLAICSGLVDGPSWQETNVDFQVANGSSESATLPTSPSLTVLAVNATQWDEPLTGGVQVFNADIYDSDRNLIPGGVAALDENGLTTFFADVAPGNLELVMKPTSSLFTEGGSWQDGLNDLRHPFEQRRSSTYRQEPQNIEYSLSEVQEAINSGESLELTHYAIPNTFYEAGTIIANFTFFQPGDPFSVDWSGRPHEVASGWYSVNPDTGLRSFVIAPQTFVVEDEAYTPQQSLLDLLHDGAEFITDSLITPNTGWEYTTSVLPLDSPENFNMRVIVAPEAGPNGVNFSDRDQATGVINFGNVLFNSATLPNVTGGYNESLESVTEGQNHANPYGPDKLIIGNGQGVPIALDQTRQILAVRIAMGASTTYGPTIDFTRFDYVNTSSNDNLGSSVPHNQRTSEANFQYIYSDSTNDNLR